MSELFKYKGDDEHYFIKTKNKHYTGDEVADLLNEQQSTIKEYEDFCYNLCMFIISRNLDDEFREKYGKDYKIITKWVGCGIDD